jgi:hypothetical protein
MLEDFDSFDGRPQILIESILSSKENEKVTSRRVSSVLRPSFFTRSDVDVENKSSYLN